MTRKIILLTFVVAATTCLCSQNLSLNNYADFDFKPGEKVLFDDDLKAEKIGDKPLLWNSEGGKFIVTGEQDGNCISVLEYYTKFSPKLKLIPDSFTLEYDTWLDAGYDGNPGIEIHLIEHDMSEATITPNKHDMVCIYPNEGRATKNNPEAYFGESKFYNRWVHISIAYFKRHLIVYLDQYKQLDIEDCRVKAKKIVVTGNTSGDMKILIKNVKITTGVKRKLELANGKFITHAIKFDVDKWDIKPESFPILNDIAEYLKINPEVKFEIAGHTDNTGSKEHNLTLSQKRAEAILNQLVIMGVKGQRLSSKGYGDTSPLTNNASPEGKANNRRAEFIIIK